MCLGAAWVESGGGELMESGGRVLAESGDRRVKSIVQQNTDPIPSVVSGSLGSHVSEAVTVTPDRP